MAGYEDGSSSEMTTRRSVYKTCRIIKRRENSIYNALRSIYEDSIFVAEIAQLWPELPLVANLRCGLWYSSKFEHTCYFKSTDGHTNNLSFSTARLNLHLAALAGQRGGCVVVDSTRKGKRFPDSTSKTIPIWACVLNRAIRNRFQRNSDCCSEENNIQDSINWDSSLHLPLWVSKTEASKIENLLDEWTNEFENSGADIDSLVSSLKKPLRPMWISSSTVIWLNEVPGIDSWDFTPIILLSASSPTGKPHYHRTMSEFSWNYIPGAGDDEESWARGITPDLFWKNAFDIVSCGPDLCNHKVAQLVEMNRVYRAQRGEVADQIIISSTNKLVRDFKTPDFGIQPDSLTTKILESNQHGLYWLGSTNLSIGSTSHGELSEDVDAVLNCDTELPTFSLDEKSHLHLPIQNSKMNRSSLLNNLPLAFNFARIHLNSAKKLLICCRNGEDLSVCVCLAILASLFDQTGSFDDGKLFKESLSVTKLDLKRRLTFICKYASSARPSRGNLKQVFCFLNTTPDIVSEQ